jgi:lipopolysaccharide export system permease protein
MTLITYVYRKFIPLFAGSLIFFSLVLVLVELLMNLWTFIANQIPGLVVLHLMVLYIPKTIWYGAPLAILFAASYTISDFYANDELIAVFASGIPLVIFSAPLLVFSFCMSIGMFFFEDRVVVPTYAQKVQLQESILKKEKNKNNDNIVVIADNGLIVYKADFYEDGLKRLTNVFIVVRNADRSFNTVIRADSAVWKDSRWIVSNAVSYTQQNHIVSVAAPDAALLNRLIEPPETFRNNTVNIETVSTREARQYIDHLVKSGLPSAEARSLYYKKFSFPFVIFIVVFLSVGLSGKTRKNVLLTSLSSSISAAVLFYITQMVTMLLAKFGYISPFTGAWFPVCIFIIISCIFVKYART